ncbi:gustatory receptor for sugar taste 64c-like [Uranotaenia lowii]|uniref:gustatory receptor for sugar taste 64c-like n=1 Tax=Uranotaenia lowii TaxID=190385 RepID=UPI00247A656F|nr:gustatory receptor for sugar taste 64c-like [Uranotaenia lowii]
MNRDFNVSSTVEDVLHVVASMRSNGEFMERCTNGSHFWELFYRREHAKVFRYMDYNLPMVLIVEFTHKVYLFMWTFMDLFITLVSMGLSVRFEQLYNRIEHHKGKILPEVFWAEIRHDYTRISNLVGYMDRVLSPMVVITCASDIYFIAYQLYMSVQLSVAKFGVFYFRYSLSYLILRSLLMLLSSSHVYVASRKPLAILRSVPMSSWNITIQRFTNEIKNIDNALSGHKFFFLKRGVILAMAGTLITYELVMLSEVKPNSNGDICDIPDRL